jgi:hypothetical protein
VHSLTRRRWVPFDPLALSRGRSFSSSEFPAEGNPIYAPYEEHVPPDVTAGIFWSKNRRPDKWRDTWHLEAAVGKYLISDKPLTPEQWIKERALLVDAEAVDVTPKEEK